MEVQTAIYSRRATRSYLDEHVSETAIRQLIDAAIQAPNAMNLQPWSFVVIQDQSYLRKLSDTADKLITGSPMFAHVPPPFQESISSGEFNIFYNAPALIVIYSKPISERSQWDCCLAGENLMLAATAMGLATCVIGFAWEVLNLPETKKELNVPDTYEAVLPIIVGRPKETSPSPGRNEPEILSWLGAPVAR